MADNNKYVGEFTCEISFHPLMLVTLLLLLPSYSSIGKSKFVIAANEEPTSRPDGR